jgi:hypothetical protein
MAAAVVQKLLISATNNSLTGSSRFPAYTTCDRWTGYYCFYISNRFFHTFNSCQTPPIVPVPTCVSLNEASSPMATTASTGWDVK